MAEQTHRTHTIQCRTRILVNTDPLRRCYNGCHAETELVWSDWLCLEFGVAEEKVEERLRFWRELNDYAVSQRGPSAKKEYRAVPCQP
jgi:hypothetical protein